ncbi:MAG TPA: hypothetical protein VN132_08320 [Bdellovibrio sp.]|nr:hypothetical protein [Bdellovibrio sp.]
MKTKMITLLLALLTSNFAHAIGGQCVPDGYHRTSPDFQRLCSVAASQMINSPGYEAQICQGYAGCVYIPPQIGGQCVPDRFHQNDPDFQRLCSFAATQMMNTPGREAQTCQGFAGCVYFP